MSDLFTYDYLERNGRLGNQLFQIAATAAAAKSVGGSVMLKPDWEYRNYFCVPDEFFTPKDRAEFNVYDGGTEYFQEWRIVEPVAREMFEWFQLNPDSVFDDSETEMLYNLSSFDEFLQEHVESGITNCCLHVRRGDYLKHPRHFPIMTEKYFTSAVNDVKARNGDTAFFVFSDDIDWCANNREFFGFETFDEVYFMEGVTRPVEVKDRKGFPADQWDLFKMSSKSMTEHIISNSTFSWWGAFLAGNEAAIYPDQWFGKAVPNHKEWELIIPPGWRKFEC